MPLLTWFSRHPLVALSGWIVGIIGLPLSIWLYLLSVPSRETVLMEPPVRSVFVNRDVPAVFELHIKGTKIEKKDVFAAQLAVWNNGNQSIRPENVLEPIQFKPTGGSQIVDAQILRKSRDVCGLAVRVAPDGLSALVDWKILEPNDGAIVQLVLVGDKHCAIGATGIIEGGGKPTYLRIAPQSSGSSQALSFPARDWLGWGVLIGISLLFLLGAYMCLVRDLPKAWRRRHTLRGRRNVVKEATGGLIFAAVAAIIGYALVDGALHSHVVPSSLLKEIAAANAKPN